LYLVEGLKCGFLKAIHALPSRGNMCSFWIHRLRDRIR
jgi:hypothetical protein